MSINNKLGHYSSHNPKKSSQSNKNIEEDGNGLNDFSSSPNSFTSPSIIKPENWIKSWTEKLYAPNRLLPSILSKLFKQNKVVSFDMNKSKSTRESSFSPINTNYTIDTENQNLFELSQMEFNPAPSSKRENISHIKVPTTTILTKKEQEVNRRKEIIALCSPQAEKLKNSNILELGKYLHIKSIDEDDCKSPVYQWKKKAEPKQDDLIDDAFLNTIYQPNASLLSK